MIFSFIAKKDEIKFWIKWNKYFLSVFPISLQLDAKSIPDNGSTKYGRKKIKEKWFYMYIKKIVITRTYSLTIIIIIKKNNICKKCERNIYTMFTISIVEFVYIYNMKINHIYT